MSSYSTGFHPILSISILIYIYIQYTSIYLSIYKPWKKEGIQHPCLHTLQDSTQFYLSLYWYTYIYNIHPSIYLSINLGKRKVYNFHVFILYRIPPNSIYLSISIMIYIHIQYTSIYLLTLELGIQLPCLHILKVSNQIYLSV